MERKYWLHRSYDQRMLDRIGSAAQDRVAIMPSSVRLWSDLSDAGYGRLGAAGSVN